MKEAEWFRSKDLRAMLRLLHERSRIKDPTYSPAQLKRKIRLFACGCCRLGWDQLKEEFYCPLCDGEKKVPAEVMADIEGAWLWCTYCDRKGQVNLSHKAIETAERYADGEVTFEETDRASDLACRVKMPALGMVPSLERAVVWTAHVRANGDDGVPVDHFLTNITGVVPPETLIALLHEVIGNPFVRPLFLPKCNACFGKGKQWNREEGRYEASGNIHCGDCKGKGHAYATPNVLAVAQGIYNEHAFDRMPQLWDTLADAGCEDEIIRRHCLGEQLNGWHGPRAKLLRTSGDVGWGPMKCPHVRGCYVLDAILGKS